MKDTFSKAIFLILGTFLALLFTEVSIRVLLPQNLSGSWFEMSKKGYQLNKARKSVRHQFEDRTVYYSMNKLHLRGPLPQKDKKNVLLLGDSFTFGWLVPDQHTLRSNLMKQALETRTDLHFLNGGTGGWGTAQQVEFLKEYGDAISPESVVLIMNVDDVERSYRFFQAETSPQNAQSITRSVLKKIIALDPVQFVLTRSHLMQILRKAAIHFTTESRYIKEPHSIKNHSFKVHRKKEDSSNHFTKIDDLILELKEWCNKRNIHFMITTTGWFIDEHKNTLSARYITQREKFFLDQHIPFFDISNDLKKNIGVHKELYYIKNDGHPNEKATEMMAQLIWDKIHPAL